MRQAAQPAPEETVDMLGAEAVADLLQLLRVVASEEAVVELDVPYALAADLALGPLVAIDPDAHAERRVRRELDEAEAEIPVEQIEIVLVDVDLTSVEGETRWAAPRLARELPLPLLDHAKSRDHLLSHADHHDALFAFEASQVFLGDILLALLALEPHNGDVVSLSEGINAPDELVGQPAEQLRRRDGPAAVLGKEPPEILGSLQPRHVPVEVQAVDAVDVEGDVVAE